MMSRVVILSSSRGCATPTKDESTVIPSGTPRGISINERRNFSVEMLRDYAQHDIFARLEEHFRSRVLAKDRAASGIGSRSFASTLRMTYLTLVTLCLGTQLLA